MEDIRWQQRFSNYQKALARLTEAVNVLNECDNVGSEQDLLKEGLIQRFEYTHELAWKVMKDYLEYQGYVDIRGSRDAIRKSLELDILSDRRWMATIEARNLTSHNYDDETADNIYHEIMEIYYPLFIDFEAKMLTLF
ncbi:MAG: nucleotidyltransferase substrate binding protein [Paludibacteraceae bacterium]|nr:nucleotidyltransferase substrate binding protein [Paludibacteraceae bacterium]MBR5825120.1 nucleotidyltransferase substrate binding protein [Paludibacteraceae bacterium]